MKLRDCLYQITRKYGDGKPKVMGPERDYTVGSRLEAQFNIVTPTCLAKTVVPEVPILSEPKQSLNTRTVLREH